MLNLFTKQKKGEVLVLSIGYYFKDYKPYLLTISNLFYEKYGLLAQNFIYSDFEYKDYTGNLNNVDQLNADKVQMIEVFCEDRIDKEEKMSYGIMCVNDERLFYISSSEKYPFGLLEMLKVINTDHINYGYSYRVNFWGNSNSYILDASDANKKVIDLPHSRLTKDKMWCLRKNNKLLLQGVMKDIFRKNVITKFHLDKISETAFIDFLRENNLLVEIHEGLYYFEFNNDNLLNEARKIAYESRLVLCS